MCKITFSTDAKKKNHVQFNTKYQIKPAGVSVSSLKLDFLFIYFCSRLFYFNLKVKYNRSYDSLKSFIVENGSF